MFELTNNFAASFLLLLWYVLMKFLKNALYKHGAQMLDYARTSKEQQGYLSSFGQRLDTPMNI